MPNRQDLKRVSRWTNQRIAFGKPLNAQAVIRAKLANMIARVEASQNWLETVTHQMNNVGKIPLILCTWDVVAHELHADVV